MEKPEKATKGSREVTFKAVMQSHQTRSETDPFVSWREVNRPCSEVKGEDRESVISKPANQVSDPGFLLPAKRACQGEDLNQPS